MSRSSSDAAVEIVQVGRDGIEFHFGAELHLPHIAGRPPAEAPAAGSHEFRITAVSPPPTRDGQTWESGLLLPDPNAPEEWIPFNPDATAPVRWQDVGVGWVHGIPALDPPAPETIILRQDLSAPFEWGREMTFLKTPDPRGFLSVSYDQPFDYDPDLTSVGVNYYGEYTLPWRRPLEPGDWIAFGFDDFTPPERQSADFIAQIEDVYLFRS